ncbi:MAG TPA: fructosamine kinase family protein [Micromonosporaceae bacterium]
MDLAYLRTHPEHLSTFRTHQRIRETPVHGGSISSAFRLTLDDGASIFLKTWPESSASTSPAQQVAAAPPGFFEAEAAGLDWLRVDEGVPIPEVIFGQPQFLALEWLDEGEPRADAAYAFGEALARTHQAGADAFGAPWQPAYIGALPLDNTVHDGPWSSWFATYRLEPYLRISADRGALSGGDVAAVEQVIAHIDHYAGDADAESPARIHGDLWPGNLLWAEGGPVYLIDPAAHGGHRETDLANLALFGGAPHLSDIVAGYQSIWPLSPGWQARQSLHQLHLLLVHTSLFGAGYRDTVMSAIRATVEP